MKIAESPPVVIMQSTCLSIVSGRSRLSEPMDYSSLFHNLIRGVPRLNLLVYREFTLTVWAIPDFMVALTLPIKVTSVFLKDG